MLIQSLPIFLFAIPWTAFALFWMAGAAGFKLPAFNSPASLFPLFGLPFVFVGLVMFWAPFQAGLQAKNTFYAITDRRAIIVQRTRRNVTCRTFRPGVINRITTKVNADGSGDILFGPAQRASNSKSISILPNAFYSVADAIQVEQLLRDVALVAGSTPSAQDNLLH